MNDDLNKLKSLMDDATPKPDHVRRTAHIALAQDSFAVFHQARNAKEAAPTGTIWQRASAWLQSGPAKGLVTASVLVVAASLFLETPPSTNQLSAPVESVEPAQEGLVAEFAAPAQMITADDAPVAARMAARSVAVQTSYDAIRAALLQGKLPSQSDVQIAEMVNAFAYDSDTPEIDANFAEAIESFGILLRDPQAVGDKGYDDVIARAQANLGPDISGQRAEAVMLMRLAKDLSQ
ncbi:von Willebrand factor type A domain-containing protein [Yoonia sp.]|uniref:YfbK domain-containing protein n=1 Tax=Yoonia sp. TaxID=2212373 RepID=UPI0025E132E8|nr:von Willebrand factor type A domain-containing protein [Yoonia sp.]